MNPNPFIVLNHLTFPDTFSSDMKRLVVDDAVNPEVPRGVGEKAAAALKRDNVRKFLMATIVTVLLKAKDENVLP